MTKELAVVILMAGPAITASVLVTALFGWLASALVLTTIDMWRNRDDS